MSFRSGLMIRVTWMAFVVMALPAMARANDVTFTVPVHIENIHSDWVKVAVYCGEPPYMHIVRLGEIDVSNKAGGSVDQTVTGTIPMGPAVTQWQCYLTVQHQNEGPISTPINQNEYNSRSVVHTEGQF
ncbi:MAG TPA: hypothetical protein VNI58_09385 [Mariprofundaceae bacterium]|nr:hypothetical protein [Mariprofundaceae bacterium]